MQHFPASVPPIRAASAAQYGIATPSGPVIPASRLPLAGRHVHAPAPAPAATSSTPTSSKIQPQLQHLPRFQPPSFESANGTLPCPDSPGSTPREEEESQRMTPDCPSASDIYPSKERHTPQPLQSSLVPGSSERQAQERQTPDRPADRPHQELTTPAASARDDDVGGAQPPSKSKRPSKEELPGDAHKQNAYQDRSSHGHQDRCGSFAVGSFVEYKSRSSGLWILAKVEGYDEGSQTYRLDVQPHAHVDRVRPRGGERPDPEPLPRELTSVSDARKHSQAHQNGYYQHGMEPTPQLPPLAAVPLPTAPLKEAKSGTPESRQDLMSPFADKRSGEALSELPEHFLEGSEAGRILTEVQKENEALRSQLSRLQSDNDALQERLMQEIGLKDRYFNELCLCHEQMQRVRNTPR